MIIKWELAIQISIICVVKTIFWWVKVATFSEIFKMRKYKKDNVLKKNVNFQDKLLFLLSLKLFLNM